jgi:glucose-1-phosphate cytidylyltransferase
MDKSELSLVRSFNEKTEGQTSLINGGFFVLEPGALDYIKDGDKSVWEKQPLESLAHDQQLAAFSHYGFWQPMDTLRDKTYLEELWNSGKAPWKSW